MKQLKPGIMEDYGIPFRRPGRLLGVQFGDDPLLMGLVDRLFDDANAAGAGIGLAVVQPGREGHAAALKEQEGLYTVFVRGERGEKAVRREQVVQSVLQALDPEKDDAALMALARAEGLGFLLLSEDPVGEHRARDGVCAALAARFLLERHRSGLALPPVIALGERGDCGERLRGRMLALAREWRAEAAFTAALEVLEFAPGLADCLTFRSTPEEAVRLCREMNYRDAMIHLAEPYGLVAVRAGKALRALMPMEGCPQWVWTDDLEGHLLRKHRLFDAGLFALAAPGRLRGCRTLADCMRDEPLRALAGHAMTDEVLPGVPLPRRDVIEYMVTCYERYGNPLNDNRLEDAARGLVRRCIDGVLPAVRAYMDDHFAPPPNLTVALAAMVLLLADTRPGERGPETVLDGESVPVHESPEAVEAFSTLSSDMDPDSLAYAVLSDRTLWEGADLRRLDGLAEALAKELAG